MSMTSKYTPPYMPREDIRPDIRGCDLYSLLYQFRKRMQATGPTNQRWIEEARAECHYRQQEGKFFKDGLTD